MNRTPTINVLSPLFCFILNEAQRSMRFRLAAAALISGSLLLGLGEVDAAGLNRTAPTTATTSLAPKKRGSFSNTSQNGSSGRSPLDDIANAVPNDTTSLPNGGIVAPTLTLNPVILLIFEKNSPAANSSF
jgi:hypothetical protein